MVLRTLRDLAVNDLESVIIDDRRLYDDARAFAQVFMPELSDRIQFHAVSEPLFTHYHVEERLATIYDRKVQLPSGGTIVMEQTEALVSIDVNSARSKEGGDVATTALMTNLEAVGAIAEQLILRDLGGLVIVDFIDMEQREHQRLVQLSLRKALLKDKAKTHVAPMSRFGLVEMTRQRTRPSHRLVSHKECPHCRGIGIIKTSETFEIDCMRSVRDQLGRQACARLEVIVPADMAVNVLNNRRQEIAQLEGEFDCRIQFTADSLMKAREFRMVPTLRKRSSSWPWWQRSEAGRGGASKPLAPLFEERARAIAEAKAMVKVSQLSWKGLPCL